MTPRQSPTDRLLLELDRQLHQQDMRKLYKAVFRFSLHTKRGIAAASRTLFRAFLDETISRHLAEKLLPIIRRMILLNLPGSRTNSLDSSVELENLIGKLRNLLGIYNRPCGRPPKRPSARSRFISEPPHPPRERGFAGEVSSPNVNSPTLFEFLSARGRL
jgi:hypothetical protein